MMQEEIGLYCAAGIAFIFSIILIIRLCLNTKNSASISSNASSNETPYIATFLLLIAGGFLIFFATQGVQNPEKIKSAEYLDSIGSPYTNTTFLSNIISPAINTENVQLDGQNVLTNDALTASSHRRRSAATSIKLSNIEKIDNMTRNTFQDSTTHLPSLHSIGTEQHLELVINSRVQFLGGIIGQNITINTTSISEPELAYLNGLAPGTGEANKAVILDSDKSITGLENVSASFFSGSTTTQDENDGSHKLVNTAYVDRAVTANEERSNATDTAHHSRLLSLEGALSNSSGITVGTANLNADDINKLNNITAGTASGNKAVVLDAGKNITGLGNVTSDGTIAAVNLDISGDITAASLDISGNVDIDGITNLDVVDIDGAVDMASTLTVTDVVSVDDTTDSTDTVTGSFHTDGGVGIAKKLFVGTDLNIAGASTLTGAVDMASTLTVADVVSVDDTTDSTDTVTGSFHTDGGVGIAKKLFVGTDLNIAGASTLTGAVDMASTLTVADVVSVDDTTDSTDTVTGSFHTDGGVGIAKKLFVGTDLNIAGASTLTGAVDMASTLTVADVVSVDDTTEAYNTVSGSFHTDGGVGIAKNLFVGTDLNIAGASTLTGAVGMASTLTVADVVSVDDTTDSTDTVTGSFHTDGGVGIAKKLFVGTDLNIAGASTLSGAVVMPTTLAVTGAITASSTLAVNGEVSAASLDISGDVDVDGTANLDAVDIDGAVDMASTLAVTGPITSGSTGVEHGAGAISSSFPPITRRSTHNGIITTQIHFDLTGLKAAGANVNDVIGVGTDPAFLGRYVTSTYGIVYKAELACLELPVAGSGTVTTHIDIATNGANYIAYDATAGTTKLFDNDGMVAGQHLMASTPALTNNDYFYLVEGNTAASNAIFSAGQYVLTLYGFALTE